MYHFASFYDDQTDKHMSEKSNVWQFLRLNFITIFEKFRWLNFFKLFDFHISGSIFRDAGQNWIRPSWIWRSVTFSVGWILDFLVFWMMNLLLRHASENNHVYNLCLSEKKKILFLFWQFLNCFNFDLIHYRNLWVEWIIANTTKFC